MSEAVPTSQAGRVSLLGVSLDALTEAQVVDEIAGALRDGRGGWVVTPNLDFLRRATRDEAFLSMLDEPDLAVADGMPLIWASRVQGTPLPERVAGSSLVSSLASRLAAEGKSLYLLGGDPGAAESAAAVLVDRYPGLRIAGTSCPPMGFDKQDDTFQQAMQPVLEASPDVVYVALGSPKQEYLIRRWRGQLPGAWWLGVGISLSFLSGQVHRAPRWVQKLGLEWVHRMIQEPGRLWRRYLVDGLPFAGKLMASAIRRRLRRGN